MEGWGGENFKQMKSEEKISRTPFPNSTKIYVDGTIHPIKVAMREIVLADTKMSNGRIEKNPPVTVYDTSGPFTDPNIEIDIRKGLPRIREQWILDRNDVEELSEISSEYGKKRLNDEKLNELRFGYLHKPMRAKKGANVSQLYYAKQGIITPEMEYIAIRENQRLELINDQTKAMQHQHEGNSWGANTPSPSGRAGVGLLAFISGSFPRIPARAFRFSDAHPQPEAAAAVSTAAPPPTHPIPCLRDHRSRRPYGFWPMLLPAELKSPLFSSFHFYWVGAPPPNAPAPCVR